MNEKTIILHHSADFDGLFCREIAKNFLPGAEVIGWDFPDKALQDLRAETIYILDLPVDRPFGLAFDPKMPFVVDETATGYRFGSCTFKNVIWIDHHKSSIESHQNHLFAGYRIDGVAACRLAWQWFLYKSMGRREDDLPTLEEYKERKVIEPVAVTLAGEYDIWDHRDPRALVFQFGLRSRELARADWDCMLQNPIDPKYHNDDLLLVERLLIDGKPLYEYQKSADESIMRRSFTATFEGLKLLCLNTARCNSITFTSKDVPETGHDALCAFYWNGRVWTFSLYHANHRRDLDLSEIARKYGGGGHRGACGFPAKTIPFQPYAVESIPTKE